MTDLLPTLVPLLANALLHFLWQGALVGLLAALALAVLRNARPQARYAVACTALLACLLLPLATLLQSLPAASDTPSAAFAIAGDSVDATLHSSAIATQHVLPLASTDLQPWIVALWAAGVGLLSLRMSLGLAWVRRLCRDAHGEGSDWQVRVDRLASRLGIGRKVVLHLIETGDSPITAGWWRPIVLLPAAIATHMPADLVEALIAHELAHVRRHDYLVNLLQGAVEALLFYHPVVWWLSHRIRIERELVADDLAAAALGEPRRLALALAELDRHAGARSLVPSTRYAPAAHGGHLMSRIRQLVRPQRRAIGSAIALPLVGLAVAGVAFYAQAHFAPPASSTQASTAPVITTPPPASPAAPVAPPAPPAPPAAPAGTVPSPPSAPAKPTMIASRDDKANYALVRKDGKDISISGNVDDADDIGLAREQIDGEFLWFRRDGKAWVVRDADTVARARQAWASTDKLSEQMQALDARMKPHSERLQAMGEKMQALSAGADGFDSPETRAATTQMEALGKQMQALAVRQAALASRMQGANETEQAQLEREQEGLAREQEAVSRQMQRHGATLEAAGERMKAQHAPMEALGREMEAAAKPMEAIGKEMEALGTRIEREAKSADAMVRKLIDEAYASGRAQPAPTRR